MPLGCTFRNYIFLAVLFAEGFSEGALWSELVIAPFVERFKVAAIAPFVERFKVVAILSKSYW